jgi:hypothetical protein
MLGCFHDDPLARQEFFTTKRFSLQPEMIRA